MTRRTFQACLFFITLFLAASPVQSGEPIAIGSRRELFVDDFLLETLSGRAELRLHHPTPREIAIVHDAPWEGTSSGYHTVFQDGGLYRMYYRGLHLDVSEGRISTGRHEPFYCYAESKDGLHWTKPNLKIIEFEGSKNNNIILRGRGAHNFTPFKDENPRCAPQARYKALGGLQNEGGLFAFQSADGVHWSLMHDKPVITHGVFDSQNLAYWDSVAGAYRAYWRIFTGGATTQKVWKPEGNRAIRTGTSDDFLHWGQEADLTYVDSPNIQLYTNQIKPYYRAPHIQIGIPTRYIERGWSDSMRALPDLKSRELRASAHLRYGTAITEGMFMASRDSVRFKRWNEAFLRPGIGRPGTWLYGQHFIAWQAVETESSLPGAPPELSFYATENKWQGKGTHLRRYTLRLDGFVSIHAPFEGGKYLSKPLTFSGDRLTLNVSTSAAGSVRVEIQDLAGKPLEGFSLADCPDQFGDSHQHVVSWKGGADVGKIAGQPVRLLLQLNDADLYSLQFVK